ncbi:Nif3-like dinuclear metal center hexameric protein [Crocinitomix catalasitica]|uniref:Nif3-like dinuclear metal center hexameric protein n=1 Tax=Crocinitomix catalasitica TaxID=184607 RepID=UPI0004884D6C|nr:Nif3-like dinuclear metal center hexameric protein [Crocinitomix catalasitica]
MKIAEITAYLEGIAPLSSQESYDNSGLIVGQPNTEITNALISLDCTEIIVDEAIARGCNLIIAHHPIVFKGLKKFNGSNYVERTIIKAIENKIAIYAIHTNLDNSKQGVNYKIGKLLGINKPHILAPKKNNLIKLITYCPNDYTESIKASLFEGNAGEIGDYSECSFSHQGIGTFKANEDANPFVGDKGEQHRENETRIEVVLNSHIVKKVIKNLLAAHPYESVAYDLIPLANIHLDEGAGMYGELEVAMDEVDFLNKIKSIFNCGIIRHTALRNKSIKKVAWCGGAGSFLLNQAKGIGADIFITGDFKYHEFFDAENQLIIADIGHFESEQFTIEHLGYLLRKKFRTFAPCLTENNTNPVKYF